MPSSHFPGLLCTLLATISITAQSPLTTLFNGTVSNAAGGMTFFDLDVTDPAGVQIDAMDINTLALAGGITFWTVPTTWVGSEANASAWTSRGSGSFTNGAGFGQPTQVCFGAGFYLPPGQYGVAIAQGPTTGLIRTAGHLPVPLTYSTAELTLTAGATNNSHFNGAPFNPRIINTNIYYNVGPAPGSCIPHATVESYGRGCNQEFASFYELVDTLNFDLSNFDITGTNTGSGYSIQANPGSGILPVGSIGNPVALTLGDDNQVPTGTLGMVVGSNGWVARGGGNSNGFHPLASTMLANPSEAVYTWTDLQPDTSGMVSYEEDMTTGATRTTYDGVFGWSTTDPHFIQIDYNTTSGNWVIRFGSVGFNNPEGWLVGFSPPGLSTDPGSTDISTATPFATQVADALPLTTTSNAPRLGNQWDITTTNIDAVSPFVLTFFGDRGPPLPLSLIGLNAPGCDINLATIFGEATASNSAGTGTASAAIPNNTAFSGLQLAAQSVCLTLTNSAALLTSSSVEGTVGL